MGTKSSLRVFAVGLGITGALLSSATSAFAAFSESGGACTPAEVWVYGSALSEDWRDLLGTSPGKPFDTFSTALALKQQSPNSPELQSLADYLIARSYFSAKLTHLAHQQFLKLASVDVTPQTIGIHVAAFECLARIQDEFPSLGLTAVAIDKLLAFSAAKLPPKMKKALQESAFVAAKQKVGAAVADEVFAKLLTFLAGSGSYESFLKAVAAQKVEDHPQVVAHLKKVVEDPARPPAVESHLDLVYLMLGRSLYTLGKFKEAGDAFVRVPRESNLLVEALSDLTWSHFMSGKIKEATGTAMNLQKTGLKRAFAPEGPMVMAMILNELCRYPQAIRAVQYFRKHHDAAYKYLYAWQTAQKSVPAGQPAGNDLYQQLVQFLDPNGKSSVPDLVASEWIRSPTFISAQQEINLLSDEKRSIVRQLKPLKQEQQVLAQREPALRQEIAEMKARIIEEKRETKSRKISSDLNVELKKLQMEVALYRHRKAAVPLWYKTLRSFHENTKNADGALVAKIERDLIFRNNRMIKQLLRVAENTQLVEIEIYDGASEDMVWRNANPQYKEMAKTFKDERKPSSNGNAYNWGTVAWGKAGEKEEVWEDELGWFQGELTDECASKDKYLKLKDLDQRGGV